MHDPQEAKLQLYGSPVLSHNPGAEMNLPNIRELLERVRVGAVEVGDAEQQLLDCLKDLPFEDLGFARVDHHRPLRQGFPEVILGVGKTPAQIAAIAARIVTRGHSLLVTRTTEGAYEEV